MVGLLYERRHSLEIDDYGGVATAAPWLSTAFLITTLASIGLPLLNNFVGEFLVLQGAAQANFTLGRLRRHRRDSLRLLHAVALPARLLRRGDADEVRAHVPDLNRARVGGHRSADRDDGLDGHVYPQTFLPPVSKVHRARAGADAGQRAVPGAARGAARGGGGRCPLTSMPTAADMIRFLPEIILTVVGTLLMVLDAARRQARPQRSSATSRMAALAGGHRRRR